MPLESTGDRDFNVPPSARGVPSSTPDSALTPLAPLQTLPTSPSSPPAAAGMPQAAGLLASPPAASGEAIFSGSTSAPSTALISLACAMTFSRARDVRRWWVPRSRAVCGSSGALRALSPRASGGDGAAMAAAVSSVGTGERAPVLLFPPVAVAGESSPASPVAGEPVGDGDGSGTPQNHVLGALKS